ncbi:MAG: hypothetical protein EPGJADBJ_04490 [Saprospiraceae bacterium]|nr:hypothetical protein [Saprospiraceae bacterium]
MRATFLMLALIMCLQVKAQRTLVTDILKVTQKIVLDSREITSISVDTTLAAATDNQVATAKAVRAYAWKLGGRPVSSTAPTTGQALVWNGTRWGPADVSGGGVTKSYEAFDGVTGSAIAVTATIPATDRDYRINLYRSGIRLQYIKDFTISGTNILLVLAADDEDFVLIME